MVLWPENNFQQDSGQQLADAPQTSVFFPTTLWEPNMFEAASGAELTELEYLGTLVETVTVNDYIFWSSSNDNLNTDVRRVTLGTLLNMLEFEALGDIISSLDEKTSIHINDLFVLADSEDDFTGKQITWGTIKTTLESLFASNSHTHTTTDITNLSSYTGFDTRYYTESEVDTLLANKLATSLKGAINGLAELDGTGKVPTAQLPSYVDDVIEAANFAALPVTGATGLIYITIDDNKTYRWSGSAYVEISASLALGETSGTAYRGDRGKTAYDHSQVSGNPHGTVISDITGLQTLLDAKLVIANNLSDLANVLTARTNLGLGTGNTPTFTGLLLSGETASTIASFDASKNLKSLSLATYPSLTELSYLKGVTSSLQTQLGNLQPLDTQLTALAGLLYTGNALKFIRVNAGENGFELASVAGAGDVSKVGTPVNNQLAIWTGDGTLEGTSDITYDNTNFNIITGKNFQIAGATILSDSGGTTTLSNIDALDATTESTIESAIDTLANLTSIQGRTITLADAGADAIFGWDDSANAYQNLSASDVRAALGLATTDSPMLTAINLGHASDTTITRVSAGLIAVESIEVPTVSSTHTLTNKRITKRVTTASDATSITPNTDNCDITYQANTQAAGTLTINADGGTPTNGQSWLLKIKSTNVQTFSWNAVFVGGTNALPTATSGSSKIDYYSFIYDTVNSKWHFTGSALNF